MRVTDLVFTTFAMFACGALYGAMRNGAAEVGGDALLETMFYVAIGMWIAHAVNRAVGIWRAE